MCVVPGHYEKKLERRAGSGGGFEYVCECVWVPPLYEKELELHSSGDLSYPTPGGCYKEGSMGTLKLSTSISGDGAGGSLSYTYNIPICTIDNIHTLANCFSSFKQLFDKRQTYTQFTSMIATKYTPNEIQGVTVTSITNVTYYKGTTWYGAPELHNEQKFTNFTYKTPSSIP